MVLQARYEFGKELPVAGHWQFSSPGCILIRSSGVPSLVLAWIPDFAYFAALTRAVWPLR